MPTSIISGQNDVISFECRGDNPSHLLSSPFSFSLPPCRNSDSGSYSRLLSPVLTTVRALHFYREKLSALPFLVDSRLKRLTHFLFYFLQMHSKSHHHGGIRTHGPTLRRINRGIRGLWLPRLWTTGGRPAWEGSNAHQNVIEHVTCSRVVCVVTIAPRLEAALMATTANHTWAQITADDMRQRACPQFFVEEPVLGRSGVGTEEIDPDLHVEAGIRKPRRAKLHQAHPRVPPTAQLLVRTKGVFLGNYVRQHESLLPCQTSPLPPAPKPQNAEDV